MPQSANRPGAYSQLSIFNSHFSLASAEILATRWDFPREIDPNANATVGLYLNLSPSHAHHPCSQFSLLTSQFCIVLAITEPFTISEDFRTVRLP